MKLVSELKRMGRKKITTSAAPKEIKAAGNTPSRGTKPAKDGSPRRTVTIEAKVDVGYGNALFLRGQGHGLSWDRGIPLTCVDGSTWKWSAEADEKLKFKLLLNDSVWSQGEDLEAVPGETVEVAPAF
jgi:hypothetical protein